MIRSIGPNGQRPRRAREQRDLVPVRSENSAVRPSSSASTRERRLVAGRQLRADLQAVGVVAVAALQQRDPRRLVHVRLEQADLRAGPPRRPCGPSARARAPSRRRGSSSRGTGCRPSANSPSWSPSSRGSGPGTRSARARPSCPRRCQSTNRRTSAGRSASSGNASGVWRRTARSASRKTRCHVSCALATFGPASSIACWRSSWWTCRNSSVARRLSIRFSATTGPARGRPRSAIFRSAHTPRQPSTLTRERSPRTRRSARTPRAPRP